jgi:hypothetical protein
MNADSDFEMVRARPLNGVDGVRRRLAVYIGGFDLRGHKFHYTTFRDQLAQHAARKGITAATSAAKRPLAGKPWLKRWQADIDDEEGTVETVVDFLQWQDLIPRRRRFWFLQTTAAGIATFWTMVTKGIFRRLRNYGRSQLAFALYPFLALILNLAIMTAMAVGGFLALRGYGLGYGALGAVAGALFAAGWYWLTRRIDQRTFAWFLLEMWLFQRAHGSRELPALAHRVDAFADYVLARMADESFDEVVVLALSAGGYHSIDLVGAMLARDPDFKQVGRRLSLVTFGVAPPAWGWFGPTERFKKAIERVLMSPAVDWVNFVIRRDAMALANFNPVRDFGLDSELYDWKKIRERRIDLKRMLRPETVKALRGSIFRKHIHYMMASETGEEHDFFDVICSRKPVVKAAGF